MSEEIISQAEKQMKKAIEALHRDLASIRTGRANPALVEHIQVEAYGTTMPLNQLANIAVPEARLITIQPWDKQTMGAIERAILQANLGFNPSNDGTLIRVPIPPLTEERRKDLVKMVHRRAEEGRVSIRNNRREALEQLRGLKKSKSISEDEERRTEDKLQKLTDQHIQQVNEIGQTKETELLEV